MRGSKCEASGVVRARGVTRGSAREREDSSGLLVRVVRWTMVIREEKSSRKARAILVRGIKSFLHRGGQRGFLRFVVVH